MALVTFAGLVKMSISSPGGIKGAIRGLWNPLPPSTKKCSKVSYGTSLLVRSGITILEGTGSLHLGRRRSGWVNLKSIDVHRFFSHFILDGLTGLLELSNNITTDT
jgi:hypothetical protein